MLLFLFFILLPKIIIRMNKWKYKGILPNCFKLYSGDEVWFPTKIHGVYCHNYFITKE